MDSGQQMESVNWYNQLDAVLDDYVIMHHIQRPSERKEVRDSLLYLFSLARDKHNKKAEYTRNLLLFPKIKADDMLKVLNSNGLL